MARDEEQPAGQARQRIDKWLFFARLRKSRSLAAKSVEAHKKTSAETADVHKKCLDFSVPIW